MRLLLLTGCSPPAQGYAPSRYMAGVARGLAGLGHDVHVLTANAGSLRSERECRGVRLHPIAAPWPFRHYEPNSNAVLDSIQLLGQGLAATTGGGNWDAVCFQGWERALAGCAMAELLDAPTVCCVQATALGCDGAAPEGNARYVVEMESWAFERAEAIMCSSRALKDEVEHRYGVEASKLQAAPHAPDDGALDPGESNREDFRLLLGRPDDLVVLSAGRLEEPNRPLAVIQSMPAVLCEAPHMRLVVAGDGPMSAEAMALAQEAGVAEQCLFTGPVSGPVLGCLYACCDIVVAPGVYAPSGASVVEAAGFATPSVASDTGALREFVVDGVNGIRVSPGDPDALAGTLIWLAGNRHRLREMGKAALAAAGRRSWQQTARVLLEAAEELAVRGRRPSIEG